MPHYGPLLALDISKRRIGCAGCDRDRLLATPIDSWIRRSWQDDLCNIKQRAQARDIVGFVVGYPINMNGSLGPAAQSRRDTAMRLSQALQSLPVMLQDESLTTAAVDDAFAEGRWRRPASGAALDHYAAAIILDDAIQAIARAHRSKET